MDFDKVRKNWDSYMKLKNTCLLIAGPFHKNIMRMVEIYKDVFDSIVISTYKNKDNNDLNLFKKTYRESKKIRILENTLPIINDLHNAQNIYFQCFSVVNGLENCGTDYVIKLRSDEVYSNLDSLIETLPNDKLSTNNIFVRDVSYKPFHLSDHMIVGGVQLLKATYYDLKSYIEINSKNDVLKILNEKTPAETKIFLFAIFNFVGFCKLDWHTLEEKEIFSLMKKYFYIFDVDMLSPYIVKSSVVGEITNYKKFVKNDTQFYLQYLKDIDDLSSKNALERLLFKVMYKIKKVAL